MIFGLGGENYEELNIDTLHFRREKQDGSEMFKIINKLEI